MPRITVLRDLSAYPQHPTFYHARHTRAALLSRLPAQLEPADSGDKLLYLF